MGQSAAGLGSRGGWRCRGSQRCQGGRGCWVVGLVEVVKLNLRQANTLSSSSRNFLPREIPTLRKQALEVYD